MSTATSSPRAAQALRTRPIERRANLDKADFYARYAEGVGRPVVVTDAMDAWPARAKWTFDFFKAHYGDDPVQAANKLQGPDVLHETTLGTFVDYIQAPQRSPLKKLERGVSLYLYSYKPFLKHPELRADYTDPYFVDDLFRRLPAAYQDWYNQGWILIGPKGTLSHLHVDFWHTQGWLAQVTGRKRCVLFSPEDTPYLYRGAVDPFAPDFEAFPLLREATAYEAILEPGEILFIPAGWWHHVLALENSITIGHNIFNYANLAPFLEHVIRELPQVLMPLNTASFRASLGVTWIPNGFQLPEHHRFAGHEFRTEGKENASR